VDTSWTVIPSAAGTITPEGRFAGDEVGQARIVGTTAAGTFEHTVMVEPRRRRLGTFETVTRGKTLPRYTSMLSVHGNVAYTGTWLGAQVPEEDAREPGDRMLVWDISDPLAPVIASEVVVDAGTVGWVMVRADGTIAVMTQEDSKDKLNGITLLDTRNPLKPTVISRFTQELETGVHQAWIEGDYVYAVEDGVGNGLRIIDISEPAKPRLVETFYAGESFLHDVIVQDGLALLSHWDAGVVILDVGNGIKGGSPTNPVEVSRIKTEGGSVHNVWYWKDAGYIFVGEESDRPGVVHVIDVHDLTAPKVVGTFEVAGDTPHFFWLDEDEGILYVAWYSNGLRAIDVTGELLGRLDLQGREIARTVYSTEDGRFSDLGTYSWGVQPQGGLWWVSDMNTGLWAFKLRD